MTWFKQKCRNISKQVQFYATLRYTTLERGNQSQDLRHLCHSPGDWKTHYHGHTFSRFSWKGALLRNANWDHPGNSLSCVFRRQKPTLLERQTYLGCDLLKCFMSVTLNLRINMQLSLKCFPKRHIKRERPEEYTNYT